MIGAAGRFARRFGLFWYDFIVGDSPVLALGALAILVLALLLGRGGAGVVADFVLPAVVVGTLAWSVFRGD